MQPRTWIRRCAILTAIVTHGLLAAADEPTTPKKTSESGIASLQSSGTSTSESGEGMYGISEASLLVVNNRPVVCFGVTKSPKEKEKYSYFILFKTTGIDDTKPVKFRCPGEASGSGGKTTSAYSPAVLIDNESKWNYRYQFEANQMPYKVTGESLTIDGKKFDTSEGRVFLVDLTLPKPTCKSLKVAPPEPAPEFEQESWIAAVQRAVEQLKENSAEVREFLASGAKP